MSSEKSQQFVTNVCVLPPCVQAYSLVDREVGYCQGSAFIVGLLLMQVAAMLLNNNTSFTCSFCFNMVSRDGSPWVYYVLVCISQNTESNIKYASIFTFCLCLNPSVCQMPEEEAFCVFVRLMQEYRLRELFKPSMAELGLCIYQFEYLLQVKGRSEDADGKIRVFL